MNTMKINKNENVCYETDASRLVGRVTKVVFPESVEEIKEIVRNSDVDIIPRGGGSGLVGGCVPRKEGSIVIDMRRMNKVLDFDLKSGTVFAEAGVTIKELNEKLKAVGFEFPIFTNDISTIGGMVAKGEISSLGRYGSIKEWIEEIEFVNGRGELVNISKGDVSDVCGMEGISGVILKVKIKIIPLIKRSASIFQSDNFEEVFLITKRLRLEEEVVMLKLYNPFVSNLLGFPEKYNLIIFFDSDRGKIKGDDFSYLFNKLKKEYYHFYLKGFYESEDIKFFYDKISDFVLFLEDSNISYFCDLINGIVFPFFKDDFQRISIIKFVEAKGGIFAKYGFGLKRKKLIDNLQRRIFQRVKLRYDPFNKFNRGKVLDFESEGVEVKSRPLDGEKRSEIMFTENIKEEKEEPKVENNFISNTYDNQRKGLDSSQDSEGYLDITNKFQKEENQLLFETPEEKIYRLIKQAESEEEEKVKDRLLDYERTFKSELSDEKVKNVEDFARGVSRNIVREEDRIGKVTMIDNLEKGVNNEKKEVRGRVSDSEKSLIDSIMTNKFKKENDKDEEVRKDNKY
ncbi:MAG: FAD-binding oxidoreductase [archaeon]